MATYVNDLRLKEIATGDEAGTWGTSTNTNLELIGEALGYGTQDCFASDADATTTVADGATDPARAMYFKVTSSATLTATRTLTIAPNTMTRVMLIENATTGSQSIAISQGSGGNVTIASGQVKMVYLDGAGAGAAVVDALADLELGTITVANLTATTSDINGGNIDGTVIGAATPAAGSFTTGSFSGNVGIGTSSPSSYAAAANNLVVAGSGNAGITIASGTTSEGALYFADGTSGGDVYRGVVWYNHTNNFMGFSTDTTERMRIDSSGNVITGSATANASDAVTLRQDGTAHVNNAQFSNGNGSAGGTTPSIYSPASAALAISTNSAERLRVDGSGNVGIGTGSPATLLHVSGSSNVAKLTTSSAGGLILNRDTAVGNGSGHFSVAFTNSDSDIAAIQTINRTGGTTSTGTGYELRTSTAGAGYLSYYTNGSEAMRIDSSGNLLVGTTETDIGFTDSGAGVSATPAGYIQVARSSVNELLYLNKLDNDGDIVRFSKDGTEVGSIGTLSGNASFGSGDVHLNFNATGNIIEPMSSVAGGASDGVIDIGQSLRRFKDLYLSGAAIVGAGSSSAPSITASNDTDAGLFWGGGFLGFTGGGSNQMRLDSSGNLLVGTTSSSGSSSNTQKVIGGNFATFSGGATIPASSTATILTLPTNKAGMYLIAGQFGVQNNDIYGSMMIVVANGTDFRVALNNSGSSATLSMSGANVQIANALGVPLDATATATFIGA